MRWRPCASSASPSPSIRDGFMTRSFEVRRGDGAAAEADRFRGDRGAVHSVVALRTVRPRQPARRRRRRTPWSSDSAGRRIRRHAGRREPEARRRHDASTAMSLDRRGRRRVRRSAVGCIPANRRPRAVRLSRDSRCDAMTRPIDSATSARRSISATASRPAWPGRTPTAVYWYMSLLDDPTSKPPRPTRSSSRALERAATSIAFRRRSPAPPGPRTCGSIGCCSANRSTSGATARSRCSATPRTRCCRTRRRARRWRSRMPSRWASC